VCSSLLSPVRCTHTHLVLINRPFHFSGHTYNECPHYVIFCGLFSLLLYRVQTLFLASCIQTSSAGTSLIPITTAGMLIVLCVQTLAFLYMTGEECALPCSRHSQNLICSSFLLEYNFCFVSVLSKHANLPHLFVGFHKFSHFYAITSHAFYLKHLNIYLKKVTRFLLLYQPLHDISKEMVYIPSNKTK
jgi:hypothetical protein